MTGDGDCFEVAAELLVFVLKHERDALLVHAEVIHPETGQLHGHGWVEVGGMAVDVSNGLCVVMPAPLYRAVARHGKLVEYNYHEAVEHLLQTRNYGPWDL